MFARILDTLRQHKQKSKHICPSKLFIHRNLINTGGQAYVYSAKDIIHDKEVIIKDLIDPHNQYSQKEIDILKRVSSPSFEHTAKLQRVIKHRGKTLIIMDKIDGLNLKQYLEFLKTHSLSTNIKQIIYNILLAVNELHTKNLCHLDLKLQNIMIDPDTLSVTLVDFGFADCTTTTNVAGKVVEKKLTKYCGTKKYLSPEILNALPYDGKKADIWMLGILFYYLLTEKFPFDEDNSNQEVSCLYDIEFEIWDLIKSMMSISPEDRPAIDVILTNPLFIDIKPPAIPNYNGAV